MHRAGGPTSDSARARQNSMPGPVRRTRPAGLQCKKIQRPAATCDPGADHDRGGQEKSGSRWGRPEPPKLLTQIRNKLKRYAVITRPSGNAMVSRQVLHRRDAAGGLWMTGRPCLPTRNGRQTVNLFIGVLVTLRILNVGASLSTRLCRKLCGKGAACTLLNFRMSAHGS